RAQIRRIRALTDAPFGVNLWLHPDVQTPIDPARLSPRDVAGANAALNVVRRTVGLPEKTTTLERRPDDVAAKIEVILDERVPVWSIGLGIPAPSIVERCHARGMQVMVMVTNVADAI